MSTMSGVLYLRCSQQVQVNCILGMQGEQEKQPERVQCLGKIWEKYRNNIKICCYLQLASLPCFLTVQGIWIVEFKSNSCPPPPPCSPLVPTGHWSPPSTGAFAFVLSLNLPLGSFRHAHTDAHTPQTLHLMWPSVKDVVGNFFFKMLRLWEQLPI